MRILLVDDERDLVAALAERFAIRGMKADFATSGDGAMVLAQDNVYDIAVLDIKMPKISGLELARKLRALHPQLKCIFLTGHGSEQDFEAGAASGEAYLVKPVNIEFLLKQIHKVLGSNQEG